MSDVCVEQAAEWGPERAPFHFLGLTAPTVPSFRFVADTAAPFRSEAMSTTNLASVALSFGRLVGIVTSGR